VSDLQDAERFIEALQNTGCLTCLDDFGTGFSSFAYLKHLKADVLKIDGLFIRNLPNERDNQLFVKSIVDVARGLGKITVAEFVENEDILDMLKSMGVDLVQGYHLDKPQENHPAIIAALNKSKNIQ
jgi:EAL domain-containing protein (putative c-di-GMP-specific phosphodiesterase class I)